MERKETVSALVELSNWLGAPEQDCAILGEGNASARLTETTFLVKASGTELGNLTSEGLVEIDFAGAISLVNDTGLDDAAIRERLAAARIDPNRTVMPSVETSLHAVCLELENVNFVGHTHPTAINAITCSNHFEEALKHRLFPDEVVVCGVRPLLIPYVDPGVRLAQVVKSELDRFAEENGFAPKTIYLRNHGFIALGKTAKQVKAITAMAVKSARILGGSFQFGGPHPMPDSEISRIDSRLDEHYRQRIIEKQN